MQISNRDLFETSRTTLSIIKMKHWVIFIQYRFIQHPCLSKSCILFLNWFASKNYQHWSFLQIFR